MKEKKGSSKETRILICDPVDEQGVQILKNAGYAVDVKPDITPEDLLNTVENYHGLIVRGRTKVTPKIIERGKRLKALARVGVGLDNIDLETASEKGVVVVNTPEASSNAVAELIIGLMIALSRGICRGHAALKEGRWIKKTLIGGELMGKTLGIIGLGRIGKLVADKALGLGMKILAYDVIDISAEYIEKGIREVDSIEKILIDSDFVTIHVPLLKETYHLVNEKTLSQMKSSAYLINASRGPVVDTKALAKALKKGWIAGAALDVFEAEPPTEKDLLEQDNIVLTPHIGAQSVEAQKEASIIAAEKLKQILCIR